jgi:hypothetical protein
VPTLSGMRTFRLSARDDREGVSCDADGLFVGDVPLLVVSPSSDGGAVWSVRPEAELNAELSSHYDLAVDVAAKIGGMSTVARALNQGNLVLAKIAAVQLQFPDRPEPSEISSLDERIELATDLYWCGLLKAGPDWDAKHPRTGTKPNPGWFAHVPKEPKLPSKSGWPLPHVNLEARKLMESLEGVAERAGRFALHLSPIVDAIDGFLTAFTPTELNQGEDRLVAQMKANFAPPKPLAELQKRPAENILGYELHHIVEQNPKNLEKDGGATAYVAAPDNLVKFGREKLDDPRNLVWVPRLKHEKITTRYNRRADGDPRRRRLRDVINEMDFEAQRKEGLKILRELKVLK